MTQEFFLKQITRLKSRFGEKALDPEFVQLVAREVKDMSELGFQRFVDVLIGSRTANKPPLLSEFREARLNEQKRSFDNEVRAAARGPIRPLADVLRPTFGGVGGAKEALEIARLKLRTKRSPAGEGGE